ncbi:hypothetical protein C9374_009370 [Naegleria lovaniensis]|uniref:F-box domain-containing protein n=1 Tax=Naegleria lovaniensis TaxID=51637 RepID=A0AA88KK41_NAELO|nr:uncharacterized protein C9374_009370 [Naegleria lovaniensis]KAG2377459.1 hypothetical protein C9374_009370 [Naegleria lovaniensis]
MTGTTHASSVAFNNHHDGNNVQSIHATAVPVTPQQQQLSFQFNPMEQANHLKRKKHLQIDDNVNSSLEEDSNCNDNCSSPLGHSAVTMTMMNISNGLDVQDEPAPKKVKLHSNLNHLVDSALGEMMQDETINGSFDHDMNHLEKGLPSHSFKDSTMSLKPSALDIEQAASAAIIPSINSSHDITDLNCATTSGQLVQASPSWEMLPHGILIFVMSYLSQPMLIHAMFGVCKRWYQIAKHSVLWKRIDFNNGHFKIKNMGDVIGFLDDLTSFKLLDMRKAYALGSTMLMESLGRLGQKEVIYNIQQYEFGLSLQKQEQLGIFKNGGVLLPPSQSHSIRMLHPFGEIILPSSCKQLLAVNFQKLFEVYPSLTKLVLPMCSSVSASENGSIHTLAHVQGDRVQFNQDDVEQSITDSALLQIAQFPHLQSLRISTHHKLSDQGIHDFSQRVLNLEAIEMDYCFGLTQQSVKSLLKNCKNIRSISALSTSNIVFHEQDLIELGQYGANLRELKLDVANISFNALSSFIRGCHRLESLFLRGLDGVTQKTFDMIFSELRYLRQLSIVCENPARVSTNKVYSCSINSSSLEKFHFSGSEILHLTFESCYNLKKVCIDQCKNLSGLQMIQSQQVNELKLKSSNIAHVNLSQLITSLPNLRDLELFDCQTGADNKTLSISSNIMKKIIVLMCNDLMNLEVFCSKLHSMSVDLCANIEKLILKCPRMENLQMFALPQPEATKLKHLFVESDYLTSLNLQKIISLEQIATKCKSLDSLNMANLHQLKRLELGPCPKLEKLAVGSVFLPFDERLVGNIINKCPNISMLSISNNVSLNDYALSLLCNSLSNLQALVISNCNRISNTNIYSNVLKGVQISDCNMLKSLNIKSEKLNKLFIRNCPSVDDSSFNNISVNSPNIRFVEVVNCNMLNKPVFMLPNLIDLNIRECSQLEMPSVMSQNLKKLLVVSCKKFKSFSLMGNTSGNCSTEILFSDCPSLNEAMISKELSQSSDYIQTIVFDKCNSLVAPKLTSGLNSNLKHIRFSECTNLTSPWICASDKLSTLSFQKCDKMRLEKVGTHFSGQDVENLEISECKGVAKLTCDLHVKNLNVVNCTNLTTLTLSSAIQSALISQCPTLTSVHFPAESSVSEITVKECDQLSSIQVVGQNQSLKKMRFSKCARLSDMCLASMLSKCSGLDKVRLSSCGLSRPFISHARLETLQISRCQYLERMTLKCHQLATLKLCDCHALTSVNFAETSPELKNVTLHGLSVSASDKELLMKHSSSSVVSRRK